MKEKLKEIFVQIIPVMIGVFLGYLVSDWAENKRNTQDTEKLVELVKNEISANQKSLEEVLAYHQTVRDSCRFYSSGRGNRPNLRFFKGIRVQSLSSSAYQTGLQTGRINALPIEHIQQINQLYNQQEFYNNLGKTILDGLLNKDLADTEEDMKKLLQFLAVSMTDVAIQEEMLIASYKNILEEI